MRRVRQGACVVMLLAASCSNHTQGPLQRIDFQTGSGTVSTGRLPVADTDSERERGLMNVTQLAPDLGMLFLFDGPTQSAFWMKDTVIPLSVAFWSGDGTVTDIIDMQPCVRDPCPTYPPAHTYVAALEMNLGWFQTHGVEIGDHAVWAEQSR